MPKLKSDWVCIATAGNTIDGREIEDAWLDDAAQTYDPNTYTALIWPRHAQPEDRRWTMNFGAVEAVKLDLVDGKKKLFAQITPNQFLLDANAHGQKLFTSIEVWPNFAGGDKYYLTGLAVTDIPASLGTSRLQFEADGRIQDKENTGYEPLVFTLLQDEKKSFWQHVFSSRNKTTEDPMDKAQFELLINKIDSQKQEFEHQFTEQAKIIETLSGQLQTFSQAPPPPITEPAPISTEQTTEISEQLKTFSSNLNDLISRLDKLEETAITPLPGNNPSGSKENVWI